MEHKFQENNNNLDSTGRFVKSEGTQTDFTDRVEKILSKMASIISGS